jgi:hypothetical protein
MDRLYLIGRGAWGGDTMMLHGLYSIAKKALRMTTVHGKMFHSNKTPHP